MMVSGRKIALKAVNSTKELRDFIVENHYSKKCAVIQYAYAMYEDDKLLGVVTFGQPASRYIAISIGGDTLELNRVAFGKHEPNDVSQLVGFALRELAKVYEGYVVSYADVAQGHTGSIYQATNWFYSGVTKSRTDIDAGGKHPRHHLGDTSKRVWRSPKHRYWTAVGKMRRRLIKTSKWENLEYPKDRVVWTAPE